MCKEARSALEVRDEQVWLCGWRDPCSTRDWSLACLLDEKMHRCRDTYVGVDC